MADIKIKIDLQSTTEDIISGFTANVGVNNVSKLTSETTTKNNGVAGLSFAKDYLKFTNGFLSNYDGTSGVAQMERGYNGFMFGAVAEDKTYNCTLTITGTNIDSIYVYGDKEAGQFPTEAYLDGDSSNLIYSDDNDWAIVFSTPQNSHSITFTKWNRANYNACITHLAVLMNELWLDKSWIKNVESLSQSTASPNDIFYGILANSGSANIIDRNGEILDYIEDGVLDNSNLPMTIFANGKEVQYHIINDSDYDKGSITLSIEMNNDLNDWDTLQYDGVSLTNNKNAYVVLSDVLLSINYTQVEIDEMLDTEIVYGTENTEGSVKAYLQAITIPYPYLEADTIRNTIEKFCNLAQLQVFKNSDNKIKFVSARPVATTNQITNTLVIPTRNQKSQLKEAKVLKNKYEAVNIQESQVGKFYYTHTLLSSENYNSEDIYVYTNEINPYNSQTYSNYITENYVVGGEQWLVGYFEENAIKGDIVGINPLSEPFCLARYNDNQVRGGELNVYDDFNDFKNSISNFDIHLGGVKYDERQTPYGYSGYYIFTNNYTYYFAIKKSAITSNIRLLYGAEANIYKIINKTDITKFGIENPNIVAIFSDYNKILQENTKFEDTKISSIISDNIINDYINGISNATITITCGDYYDKNGVKAKDWANGDLINVGDIVRIDKDNDGNSASVYKNGQARIWRVTGRKFRYAGVPLCDLELQEIKQS